MNANKARPVTLIHIFSLVFICIFCLQSSIQGSGEYAGVYFAGAFTFVVMIYLLLNSIFKEGIGIGLVLFNYYLSFGVLLPAVHYLPENLLPWDFGYYLYTELELIYSFAIVLIFGLIANVVYSFGVDSPVCNNAELLKPDDGLLLLAAWLLFLVAVVMVLYAGMDYIFTKRIIINLFMSESAGFSIFKRATLLLFIACMIFWVVSRSTSRKNIRLISLFSAIASSIVLFIVVNPINSARWKILGFTLSIFLVLYPIYKPVVKAWIVAFFAVAMIYIYPFMNALSRSDNQLETVKNSGLIEYFAAGDFDGFQSLVTAVKSVNDYGLRYGEGLWSAIVSIVPRGLWLEKPIHSGAYVGEMYGAVNTNLSMPLPAEFYLDFGLVGVLLGSFAFAVLLRTTDAYVNRGANTSFAYIVSVILVANMLFISRGALAAVSEFFLTMIIVLLVIYMLAKFGRRVKVEGKFHDKK